MWMCKYYMRIKGAKYGKKEYLSRKDLNSRETLAYEYMLDGLSLK